MTITIKQQKKTKKKKTKKKKKTQKKKKKKKTGTQPHRLPLRLLSMAVRKVTANATAVFFPGVGGRGAPPPCVSGPVWSIPRQRVGSMRGQYLPGTVSLSCL